jgi:hypothetical protein
MKKRNRTIQRLSSVVGLLDDSIQFDKDDVGSFRIRQSQVMTLDSVRKMMMTEDGGQLLFTSTDGTVTVHFGTAMDVERVTLLKSMFDEPNRTEPLQSIVDEVSKHDMIHYNLVISHVVKSIPFYGEPSYKMGSDGLVMTVFVKDIWSDELFLLAHKQIKQVVFYGEDDKIIVKITISKP